MRAVLLGRADGQDRRAADAREIARQLLPGACGPETRVFGERLAATGGHSTSSPTLVSRATRFGLHLVAHVGFVDRGMDQRVEPRPASRWNSGPSAWAMLRGRGTGTSISSVMRPGLAVEHKDAVGEQHRLVEIMGDEDDRDVDLAPDLQKVGLHARARLRIERGERLVHQAECAAARRARGAIATRCFMPPESWWG